MEQWYIVDADGCTVDVIMSDDTTSMLVAISNGRRIVKKPWTDGMYKPRHNEDTDEWESGETPEEKAAREAEESEPKPEAPEQKLARLEAENEELKGRVAQAQDDNLFIMEALVNASII